MAVPDVAGECFLVLGLARSGCAAGALLRRHGAMVIGYDDAPEADLRAVWAARGLTDTAAAAFDELRSGGDAAGLAQRRLAGVVLSPGFPPDHELVTALRARAPLYGELEWAARFCAACLVGITGTNGKTTTTELVAHLARGSGWQAHALGNVGRPLSQLADQLGPEALAVLEVSSFQLETIEKFRPQVAVVLNLEPDHLDRYPDVRSYWAAKRRLVEALPPAGQYVTWTACPEARRWPSPRAPILFGERSEGATTWVEERRLCCAWGGGVHDLAAIDALRLRGAPNLLNACAAVATLLALGADPLALAKSLRHFRGLPHRQQVVARRGGVVFVDDSKGTNVAAVAAGLAGYERDVVLIAGGRGKGEDYGRLRAALGPVKAVVVMGEEAPAIAAAVKGATHVARAEGMSEAVAMAASLAEPRGTVLLSPACASFDMFRDYAERGAAFTSAALAGGAEPEESS